MRPPSASWCAPRPRNGSRGHQLRPLATVWVMAEKHDREKLIDVALDLCIRQGYEATTIDQIGAAGGVTSHAVGHYFATKDAIILSIVDDIVVAVATELARIPPQTSPPEALLAANTAVISDNGASKKCTGRFARMPPSENQLTSKPRSGSNAAP